MILRIDTSQIKRAFYIHKADVNSFEVRALLLDNTVCVVYRSNSRLKALGVIDFLTQEARKASRGES